MTDTIEAVRTETPSDEVIITLMGSDIRIPMQSLSLTIDSSPADILDAVRPVVQSRENLDIRDQYGNYSFQVRKAMNSRTIYVHAKDVAGADAISKLRKGCFKVKNSKGSRIRLKYLTPRNSNDRKRIGQKLTISDGHNSLKLNGTQIRSLYSVLDKMAYLPNLV